MNRTVHTSAIILTLALAGCETPDITLDPSNGEWVNPIAADASVPCVGPEEGCACEPSQPAIDCYREPRTEEDGSLMCGAGTRYCRGGAWTACEEIEEYQLHWRPGTAALTTGPSVCNPCDPSCSVDRDAPTAADLTPGRATDLEYDTTVGGVRPRLVVGGPAALVDTDGDGVPDIADDCVGAGAVRAADGTCFGTHFIYRSLPFGGAAVTEPLAINVRVRTADVYFLMDTTGSMGGEIDRLKRDLTTGSFVSGCTGGIIGAIRCTMPDAYFGVGRFDDYPVSPYGTTSDVVFQNLSSIGASLPVAQAAVNTLSLHNGSDGPESTGQALWAIASGGGLGPYLPARTGCASDRWGYPCFRTGSIPIIVQFTDAPIHNGPNGNQYHDGFGALTSYPTPVVGPTNNDRFTRAADVGNLSNRFVSYRGNNCSGSNTIGGNTTCDGYSSKSADAVFKFTVTGSTEITINLEGTGSTYPVVTLYNASQSSLECDTSWSSTAGVIRRTLATGTYYAVVENYSTYCGDYRINLGNAATVTPPTYPVTWNQTVSALNTRNIRVITIHSGGTYGRDDADALADATGAVSASGSRYVLPISTDGTGLSAAVVNAIVDVANFSRLDLTLRAVDNTTTTFDERQFIESVRSVSWGAGSCRSLTATGFVQCLPGTNVNFAVALRNNVVMPTTANQIFDFTIEVLANGAYVLETVRVRIVVPAIAAQYAASGTFVREHHATDRCSSNERPNWSTLAWNIASMPAGTSVDFELRTAETAAGLNAAPTVRIRVPSRTSPINVSNELERAGLFPNLPHLRVTAVLYANTARTAVPVLRSMDLVYICVPFE